MPRVIVSLAVLICLTGFAPAPLPTRPKRAPEGEVINVDVMQGTWRIDGVMRTSKDGKHTVPKFPVSCVRIEGNTWTFARDVGKGTSHTFSIDPTREPAHLDFNKDLQGRSVGQGIIRRKGDVVELIYVFGAGVPRAVRFDQPPDGQFLLTLRRER